MLCSFCEGTEHSPLPNALLFDGPRLSTAGAEPDTCPDCGLSLWTPCLNCIGLGKKLKIVGACSSCGRSIPYWQACANCQGSGKIYSAVHECARRDKAIEKSITKARTVPQKQHHQHQHRPTAHSGPAA